VFVCLFVCLFACLVFLVYFQENNSSIINEYLVDLPSSCNGNEEMLSV
jgi:hypothetical protein